MNPATDPYVRPPDGALMVAIAPWVFVAEVAAGAAALAIAHRGSRRPQETDTRARREAF